jgi:hypothetical protein
LAPNSRTNGYAKTGFHQRHGQCYLFIVDHFEFRGETRIMLSASYVVAAAAICGAALYLFFRLRLFLTTTTMLLGSLLLIYGPAYLTFMLSSGVYALPIRELLGTALTNPIFSLFRARIQDFDAVIIALNLSIAITYIGIIAGIEMVDRLVPERIATLRTALTNWNAQAVRDDARGCKILFWVISSLTVFMLVVSIKENHLGTIKSFLSASDRNAYRLHFGSSSNYLYRIILGAVAPAFVTWGLLAGWLSRSWLVIFAAIVLFLAVMVGKSETLSKAPPAFFLIQLMVPLLVTFTNRISWQIALGGACVITILLYADIRLVMATPDGVTTLEAVYSRVFEAESQSLIENFATFPAMHPYMWGANIRPIAILMGHDFIPSDTIVAFTWEGTHDVTSPSLYIADAWAGFSYAGVIAFSVIAGAACRSIDAIFLANGKTVVSAVVLGATFSGIFMLLGTPLNTAFTSGGLLLAPILIGLSVRAIRYFDKPRPTMPIERAT